jgi:hypothetical protein
MDNANSSSEVGYVPHLGHAPSALGLLSLHLKQIARAIGDGVSAANDLKLSDRGVRRSTCMVGGKTTAEAGAVTHGAALQRIGVSVVGTTGCLRECPRN